MGIQRRFFPEMLRLLACVAMTMLVVGMVAQRTEGQLTLGQTVTTVIADTNHAGYARFHVLGLLVQLFVAVTDNYKVNKMKVSNMAKVFAPTFFKGMSSMGLANSIMATWIKDFEPIFQAEDYPEF